MKSIVVIALALKLVSPIDDPIITSPYGERDPLRLNSGGVSLRFHRGIDFISADGTADVASVTTGRIIESWPSPNGFYQGHGAYGGYLIIRSGNLCFHYGHIQYRGLYESDVVQEGQVIGFYNTSGRSTGAHLHFAVSDCDGMYYTIVYEKPIDFDYYRELLQ